MFGDIVDPSIKFGNKQGTSGNKNEKTDTRERESDEGWEFIL